MYISQRITRFLLNETSTLRLTLMLHLSVSLNRFSAMLFDRHTHEILTLRQVRILFFRIVFNMLKTHVSVKVGGSQKSEPC